MSTLRVSTLLQRQKESGRPYLEFLRAKHMSAGIYVLPPGATDHQQAHGEDEIYYVVQGRGQFSRGTPAGPDEQPVEPGTVLFVGAGMEHRFHDIAEELVLLVCFAPPEASTDSEG